MSLSPGPSTTISSRTKTCCPRCWPPRCARCQGAVAQGHEGRQEDRSRFISTATTSQIGWRAREKTRARSSSTGTTTARWWGCVTTTGRSCSRSSAAKASPSGRIRSCRCVSRSSSTCAPIRSRRLSKSAWVIDQWRVDRAFLLVPAQEYIGQLHRARSRSSRRARRSAASRSIRCSKGSRRRALAASSARRSLGDIASTRRPAARDRLPARTSAKRSKTSTNGIRIRGPSTISTTIDGAGRIPTGAAQTSISSGRTSRSRRRARFSSPAAEHRRQPSTLRAVLEARVIGIDVSATSVRHTEDLRRKYRPDQSRGPSVVDRSRSATWR